MSTPSVWKRALSNEGKPYYYNTQTNQTVWNRPEGYTPWKETTHTDGRKYYYNEETKETKWEMPPELRNGQSSLPPRPVPATPTFVAGGNSLPSYQSSRDRDDFSSDRPHSDRPQMYSNASLPFGAQPDQEYATPEEAEAALFKLFKRTGVQADWTWEQTMRKAIKDPQFRGVKDPKDRRTAFDRYIIDLRSQEKDKEKDRLSKLRTDFNTMLRSHPEIKHYSRWRTVQSIIEGETVYRAARSDEERKQLFEEYIVELKNANSENETVNRKSALEELSTVLNALDIKAHTRWHEAQEIFAKTERLQQDPKFRYITKLDTLKTFENHIKALERHFNDTKQKEKNSKSREERVNRDNFMSLLEELRSKGKIRAGTRWMDIHPDVLDDARYTALLGQTGSTPLDLFWDIVEEEERSLRSKRGEVLDVLEDKRFEVSNRNTLDEYMEVLRSDRRTQDLDAESLKLIFERLQDKARRRSEDDKYIADRNQRRAVDALRSKIKHLEPQVGADDTWEQVRPRIEDSEEYQALRSDELRRSAFEKFMRRLKDREEDQDRDRSRRDHRDRERDRTRDRDRDYRNGHADSQRRPRSRTPEVDAYEADRKKAQADRERQYRKSSLGLSPPYRRERDERERYDRSSRSTNTHYERERREREVERERSYISRADPRERGSELDYGDSRPGSVRRRRDSDAESHSSRRDAKRSRRDRRSRDRSLSPHKSMSPVPKEQPKEDPGLRSGSEEGEIEED